MLPKAIKFQNETKRCRSVIDITYVMTDFNSEVKKVFQVFEAKTWFSYNTINIDNFFMLQMSEKEHITILAVCAIAKILRDYRYFFDKELTIKKMNVCRLVKLWSEDEYSSEEIHLGIENINRNKLLREVFHKIDK